MFNVQLFTLLYWIMVLFLLLGQFNLNLIFRGCLDLDWHRGNAKTMITELFCNLSLNDDEGDQLNAFRNKNVSSHPKCLQINKNIKFVKVER